MLTIFNICLVDEDQAVLKCPTLDNTYLAPVRTSTVLSSFQSNTVNKLETFYEDFHENITQEMNNLSTNNYHLGRSSSFGGTGPYGTRYQRIGQTQSLRPRRNSEVVTNLQDHIRLLDEEKHSIMNLMEDEFWN